MHMHQRVHAESRRLLSARWTKAQTSLEQRQWLYSGFISEVDSDVSKMCVATAYHFHLRSVRTFRLNTPYSVDRSLSTRTSGIVVMRHSHALSLQSKEIRTIVGIMRERNYFGINEQILQLLYWVSKNIHWNWKKPQGLSTGLGCEWSPHSLHVHTVRKKVSFFVINEN